MADEEKKDMPFITKALIVGIIALLVVFASAGVSYFVTINAVVNAIVKYEGIKNDVNKADEKGGEEEEKVPGMILPVGDFTVNLKEEIPTYLVCEIQVEIDISGKDKGKGILTEVQDVSKQIIVKDKILGILSSKTRAEISSVEGKEKLKKDIMDEINNNVLKNGKIQEIYIVKWIIQ